MNEISLVCLNVHFPRLIYLLFLQKDNLGSARHQSHKLRMCIQRTGGFVLVRLITPWIKIVILSKE